MSPLNLFLVSILVKLLNRILSENVKRAQLYLPGKSMLSNLKKISNYPFGANWYFIGALTP